MRFLGGWILLLGSTITWANPGVNTEKTFVFRIPGEPESLDWNLAHTSVETHLLMNLMEGLVKLDDQLRLKPALAEKWDFSEDGRTITFKIRKDVKWTDGASLTAKDFVYSWKRLLSPLTAAPYAYLLFDVEGAEFFNKGYIKDFQAVGIKAVDDYTLRVKLARPVAHWLYIPTFWVTFPLREDVVEKHGIQWDRPGRMVTLGPFQLAAHDLNSKIFLKANPKYHGSRGNVDTAIALIVKDDAKAMGLYESGKIDFLAGLSPSDLKRNAGSSELKTFPYLKTNYLGFVLNQYPVSLPAVRRAIALAIDRAKLADKIQGGQSPASSWVPPQVLGFSKSIGLDFNPAEAKKELARGGLQSGIPLRIELLIPNWERPKLAAESIREQLKSHLGIQVEIKAFEHRSYRAQLDLKSHPAFLGSWAADYPDPDNFLSVFLGNSGNNRTLWKNQKFDDRVQEARVLGTPAARERAYLETQKQLIETDVVIVPLYYEPITSLVKPRVQGLQLNPVNYLYLKDIVIGN